MNATAIVSIRLRRTAYKLALVGAALSLALAAYAGKKYCDQQLLWFTAAGSAAAFFSAAEFDFEDNTGLAWSLKRAFALLNLLIGVFSLPALLDFPEWFAAPFVVAGLAIWRSEVDRKELAQEHGQIDRSQHD